MIISKEDYLNNLLDSFCKYEEKLNVLSNKAYPSDTVKEFIEKDLKMIISEFKEIVYNDLKANKDIFSEKTILANDIWDQGHLQNIAKAVANTDFKSHPLEIMNVFRDMIKEIEENDFEILTIATEEMNFSFNEIWFDLKKFLEKAFDINNFVVDKKLIKLTFPKNHKNNLLLSGIFFHEIGHYLVRENNLAKKIYEKINFKSENFIELKNYVAADNNNSVNQIELINIFQKYYIITWIKEILSDILAVYTVGPAFIFSIFDFVINNTTIKNFYEDNLLNNCSYSHPRFSFRLKLILKALSEIELYNELPKSLKSQIDSYLKVYEDSDTNQQDLYRNVVVNSTGYRIRENVLFFYKLEDLLLELIPTMLSESKLLLGKNNIMTKIKLSQGEKLAQRRLKEVIPPNEMDNIAADPISIINSGWFAKLLHKDSLKKRVGKIRKENGDYDLNLLINDLMKYSLRTSRIQRRWQD